MRGLLKARRRRSEYLDDRLFGEPAWDILLELYACELMGERISVSSLTAVSGVADTTALRYIHEMEARGALNRSRDPSDKRRIFVCLTPSTREGVAKWLDEQRQRLRLA